VGDHIYRQAQIHQMSSHTTQSRHRNATPGVPARRALRRILSPNASTKPLALNPIPLVIPSGYSVMSLVPQVQGTSWEITVPLVKRSWNSPPTHPLPPSLNRSLNGNWFRPLARLFLPSVATNYHPSLGHVRPTKSWCTTLPGLRSHLSPCFPLSYSPASRASPMFRYRSWRLNDSNFLMQLRWNWTRSCMHFDSADC
jgi:hypothetical protein